MPGRRLGFFTPDHGVRQNRRRERVVRGEEGAKNGKERDRVPSTRVTGIRHVLPTRDRSLLFPSFFAGPLEALVISPRRRCRGRPVDGKICREYVE